MDRSLRTSVCSNISYIFTSLGPIQLKLRIYTLVDTLSTIAVFFLRKVAR